MTWRQERANYAERYSRYHCFIVHHFAGNTVVCGCSMHHWLTPSDVDRFARFSSDLAFTWPGMSIKPPWSLLKSAQRKANAKGTQHASLFYDELPVGVLQDYRKLAAFFAFSTYVYSTRCDLIGYGPWSWCKPVKTTAEAEVDSFFDFFNFLRILPLRFRTAENTSNFRRNTDKYGRLATLWLKKGTVARNCFNIRSPSCVCLLVLRWKRGRELVHCLYKKLQTCLPTSCRPAKPYLVTSARTKRRSVA